MHSAILLERAAGVSAAVHSRRGGHMTDTTPQIAGPVEPEGECEFHVRSEYGELLARAGVRDFAALLVLGAEAELGKPGLAAGRRRARVELLGADGGLHVFYRKSFEGRGAPDGVLHWRREERDTAEREVRQMEALAAAGVPAVRWAAWGREIGPDGAERRSAVLCPAVPGDALERRLPAMIGGLAEAQRRDMIRRIGDALAQLVAKLHGLGFVHRDLYLSHIFVEPARSGEPVLTLIDVQRVFRPRLFVSRWIVKDLAALHYSTPPALIRPIERLRWLRTYLGVRRLDGRGRRLIRRIECKAAQIARHDRRRRERHTA